MTNVLECWYVPVVAHVMLKDCKLKQLGCCPRLCIPINFESFLFGEQISRQFFNNTYCSVWTIHLTKKQAFEIQNSCPSIIKYYEIKIWNIIWSSLGQIPYPLFTIHQNIYYSYYNQQNQRKNSYIKTFRHSLNIKSIVPNKY